MEFNDRFNIGFYADSDILDVVDSDAGALTYGAVTSVRASTATETAAGADAASVAATSVVQADTGSGTDSQTSARTSPSQAETGAGADNQANARTYGNTRVIAPLTMVSTTNLTGTVSSVDEDPSTSDGLFVTATVKFNDIDARFTFADPNAALTTTANAQIFRLRLRMAP